MNKVYVHMSCIFTVIDAGNIIKTGGDKYLKNLKQVNL